MTSDPTQRELEQRALRNVRGLVDKIEQTDLLDARRQRKVLVRVALVALAIAVVAAVLIAMRPGRPATEVDIDPRELPPLKGGPQK